MDFLTLTELNRMVEDRIKRSFPEKYWIMAETSDVRINQSSGHCYLELIEKNELSGAITAKARAYIWNTTFRVLKSYFEEVTGQSFASGLKILISVSIDFHSLYGYGLSICDIEPSYTVGEMHIKRQQIIARLIEDGVLEMNKELILSPVAQRIAIITSPTAAGYEDFLKHLNSNHFGFIFYPKLFSAIMQGEQTENSILSALERIYQHVDFFDAVVIIRGGGATSDLAAFDSYLLAASCAQFPIPVITGIGHERDDTVLDMIAYYRAKTPTAVADFFIHRLAESYSEFLELEELIKNRIRLFLEKETVFIQNLATTLQIKSLNMIEKQSSNLDLYRLNIRNTCLNFLSIQKYQLNEKESVIKMSSPKYILSKGYSITRINGKTVKSATQVVENDVIETLLADGKIISIVTN